MISDNEGTTQKTMRNKTTPATPAFRRRATAIAVTAMVVAAGAMNVNNGTNAALSDRGWLSLTFKTTF